MECDGFTWQEVVVSVALMAFFGFVAWVVYRGQK